MINFLRTFGVCLALVACGKVTAAPDASPVDVAVAGDAATATLTVTVEGSGTGTITSAPAGIACGATCAASFTIGSSVVLTAAADGGSTFTTWGGACSGTSATCTVTIDQAAAVTATFAGASVALTVATAGLGAGTVSSSPAGINCPTDCTAGYATGTSVILTAAPMGGSVFTGWSGACSGNQLTCSVSMTDAKQVTATFQLAFCTSGMLDQFQTADSTTIAGWTERLGNWEVSGNRVRQDATGGVYTHYMTKDGSSQTDGCASLTAISTPASGSTIQAVGVVLRWTSPSNYVVALVQDNNNDNVFDNFYIYQYPGGSSLGSLSGLSLGTTPRVKACITGTTVTLSADAANDGVFEATTTGTTTLVGAGLAGIMTHTFSSQALADDFCVGL